MSKSLDHLRFYDNREETLRPASDGLTLARSGNVDLANQLLRLMSTGATAVPACPRAEFDFVDYEINPLRTTGSEYENGVSGSKSGRGGIDVLLANRLDRFPAIGELKADTDRNPFLGFVQALMYAVELATPAQQSRLARSYPEKLTCANNGPVIDLCLFLIRYPTDPAHREFLDLVRSIVEKLALPGSAFALMVRRVVCFHTDMDVVDRAEFRIVFES